LQGERVGVLDDANFVQHWTVKYWREWTWPVPEASGMSGSSLQVVVEDAMRRWRTAGVADDAISAGYWAYHMSRACFFLAKSTAGTVLQAMQDGSLLQGDVTFIYGKANAKDLIEKWGTVRVQVLCSIGKPMEYVGVTVMLAHVKVATVLRYRLWRTINCERPLECSMAGLKLGEQQNAYSPSCCSTCSSL
jgi:hypothetical protein